MSGGAERWRYGEMSGCRRGGARLEQRRVEEVSYRRLREGPRRGLLLSSAETTKLPDTTRKPKEGGADVSRSRAECASTPTRARKPARARSGAAAVRMTS